MNELTKKLQQVMVPKAALIAYEYSDGRYGHGTYYLELHPINDRGRMEAAVPVTYEFMDSLVEYYTDNRQDVPHGKIPANMLWCDTRKGHESTSGTILRENGRCSFRKAEYSGRDIPCTRCHLQGFR